MQSRLSPKAAAVGAGIGVGTNEPLPSSEKALNANDESGTTAPRDIPTLPGFEQQTPIVRYSIDELLLLRDSSPSQIPIDFSPYTPLRLGSQVKFSESAQGARAGKRVVTANPFMGLENIPRSHKDGHQVSQKAGGVAQQSREQPAGIGRVSGVSRGSGRSQGAAMVDNSIDEHGRLGSRGGGVYPNTATPRDSHGKTGGGRHHNGSHDGNRTGAALSWRSSTANRSSAGGGIHVATDSHGNSTFVQGAGQPEWMDNDMLYDESLNAQRMQDMEDWKRRMKAGSGDPHGELAQDSAIQEQPAQHALQGDASNGGIARGSRFLRLFSESTPQNVDGGLGIQENDPVLQQAQSYAYQNTANAAGIYANGVVLGGPEAQSIQGVDGSGDQISKLFKVLGDRISVNNPQMTGRTAIQNPENMLSSQNLTAAAAAVPPPPGINNTQNQQNMHPGSMATLNSSTVSAMSHPQGIPPAGNTAESREARVLASSTGQPTKVTTPEPHRIKTSSPAPINEALRGIVPTSVFRKSVQSGSGGSGAHSCSNSGGGRQNHRPESISSSRSGTPAKNLPSWLVELSRGRSASPTNNHTAAAAAGQAPVTNGSLGSQDLVDVLEREFPALGIRPQAADNQSISSLSVQASVGVPSEGTGGDSVRHSIIETREQETRQSSDAAAQVQVSEAASYQMMSSGIAATAAPGSSQAAADGSVMQNPGTITSPDPMQGMQHHVLPPQAMMEMAPPMIMPDGTMVPGGLMHHHHPQMMGGGQMPPMAMMPPPHHSMGFHPNMMFGMMPPPPPHPGMFGNVPQAGLSMSVGQLNGIPGPTSEHQQQMIKMMMMSDMPPPPPPPPAMMYGQMSAAGAPQQHPLQQNQHQQMQMQHMPPVHPAPNSHMYSAPMAQQQHPQAFNHPQQQQQQPYES